MIIETVFALLLVQDHKIIEHRYYESLQKCLKGKRYAMKDKSSTDRVVYKCIKSKGKHRSIHGREENSFINS